MPSLYQISTGNFTPSGGPLNAGIGYSGNGEDLNNILSQNIHNHGPIPVGFYTFDSWYNDPEKGPIVTKLIPSPTNIMYGRSGFMIHGDNKEMNHTASDGCIILPHWLRQTLSTLEDQTLQVIA